MPPKYKKAKGQAEPKKSPENLQGKAKGKGMDDEEVEPPPNKKAKKGPEDDQTQAIGQNKEVDNMKQPIRYEPQKEIDKGRPHNELAGNGKVKADCMKIMHKLQKWI